MLDLAAQRLEGVGITHDRVALRRAYLKSARAGPSDDAMCLLTFHFVPREERVLMVAEIRWRLRPGTRSSLCTSALRVVMLAVKEWQGSAISRCCAIRHFRWHLAWR